MTYEEIRQQAEKACEELIETAKLAEGDILVVGCSSSEVMGLRIGKGSDINAAEAVWRGNHERHTPQRDIFGGAMLRASQQGGHSRKKRLCLRKRRSSTFCLSLKPEDLCHHDVSQSGEPRGGGVHQSRRRYGHRRHSHRDAAQECGGSCQSFSEIYRGGSSGMRQNQT